MIMMIFLILIGFCFIAVIAIVIYNNWQNNKLIKQVTPLYRGERSERDVVLRLLYSGINPRAIFHDLYIKKQNGEYTQVDLVVATSAGLIVFEVKDYSGWIFGNEKQRYWTQILAYGKERHRFYNPIMQNKGHINALRDSLPSNRDVPIFSVVVFCGNCSLKEITIYSENTFVIYSSTIKSLISHLMQCPNVNYGDKYEIMNVLNKAVENGMNPSIVCSQRYSANKYSQNKPESTYNYFRLPWGRFPYRGRWF